ncbi:MAG TPA: BamA/TamA family outer membrane protein [Rhizomicrobium sp.]|nr:BamA/TamA family outer membrane protein [Rhizomicrobium sp.]
MAIERNLSALVVALGFVLGAFPARAADPQGYTVDIAGTGASQMDAALRASSQLVTLQAAGPIQPFALVTRAQADIPRLQTAMDSFGYYQNKVGVTIDGLAADDPTLPARLDAMPAGSPVAIKVTATPGPLYHLDKITLDGKVPERDRAAVGLNSGDAAVAAVVLDARARLLAALEEDGYALAKVDGPDATADDKARTVDVTYKVTSGPQVAIGDIRINGLKDVNESFARSALTIHPGDRYQPSRIEAARQALAGLGVFSGVSVRAADHLSPDGRIPLIFDVEERAHHAVTLSGTYSTDLGIMLGTTWSHRNLFGNAEQLNLTAAGTGLGTASTGLGYNLSAQYIQPRFLETNQVLEFDVSGVKQQLDAYDQTAETIAGFVRRKFSALWSGSAGLSLTHDQIAQEGTDALYELLSVPLTVSYDSTGITDGLVDPVRGLRSALALTPTHAFGGSDATFLLTQLTASSYFDLSNDGRSVLALRGLAATILGASNLDLPPDQRLYAGGSTTVRGYAYQSLGPQFADRKPVGAKSVDAATVEFRQRFGEDWGAAVFVDGGQAGTGAPFTGQLYAGAGVGARYYTAIGAVRVDVATPLVHLPGGDAFELYIGLGQAF